MEPLSAPTAVLPSSSVALKDQTVNIRKLDPILLQMLSVAGQLHAWLFHKVLIVTSGNDGNHLPDSKHYINLAYDVRTEDKTAAEQEIFLLNLKFLAQQRGALVIDERKSPHGEHFHVQLETVPTPTVSA